MNVHIATKMLANLLGLFLAAFFISTTTCAPSGPTLNDLVSFHCPSDRPFKCLPYGACCRGSEFCYSGMCESCFPRGVEDGALLDWCREKGQFDVALMRNDGCRLACQDVFNTTQLIYAADFVPLDGTINSTAPASGRMKDVAIYEHEHHLMAVTVGLTACLVVSLLIIVGLLYIICRLRKQRRREYISAAQSENAAPSEAFTPAVSKQSSVDLEHQLQELDECLKGKGKKSTDDDTYVQRRQSAPNLSNGTDDMAASDKKKARALNSLATSDTKSCVPIDETPTNATSYKPSTIHQDLVVDIEVHANNEGNQQSTADETGGILEENDRSSHISIRVAPSRSGVQNGEEEPLLDTK